MANKFYLVIANPRILDDSLKCMIWSFLAFYQGMGKVNPVFSLGLIRSEAACIYKGTINIEISLMKLMVPMAFLFSLNNLLGLQTEIIQNIS